MFTLLNGKFFSLKCSTLLLVFAVWIFVFEKPENYRAKDFGKFTKDILMFERFLRIQNGCVKPHFIADQSLQNGYFQIK